MDAHQRRQGHQDLDQEPRERPAKRALLVSPDDTGANLHTLVSFLRAQTVAAAAGAGAAGAAAARRNVGRKSAVAEAQEALASAAPSVGSYEFAGAGSSSAAVTLPPSPGGHRGGPWGQLLPLCAGSLALLARARGALRGGGLVAALTTAVAAGLLSTRPRKELGATNPERLPSPNRADLRHGIIRRAIPAPFLAEQYRAIRAVFNPHLVSYKGQDWRISSYMELMDQQFISGKHATAANVAHAPPQNVEPDTRLLLRVPSVAAAMRHRFYLVVQACALPPARALRAPALFRHAVQAHTGPRPAVEARRRAPH